MASPTPTTIIPPKPPSDLFKGYDLQKRSRFPSVTVDFHIVRDNFTISTWLLIGASLQCLLLALPVRPSYALLPALLLLSYRSLKGALMCFGMIKNPYAEGVIPGKMAISMPESYDADGKKDEGGVCVIMLPARCNSPLGVIAPHWGALGSRFQSLITTLDTSAPANGFLGGSTWLNASCRSTCSEIMTVCYFKSHAHLQAFAHGPEHRKVWDWWNKLMKEGKVGHLSISHEVYTSEKGGWEGIYANQPPANFGATWHWVVNKVGNGSWQTPLVRGSGQFRSAKGRMGKSMGDDNVKYGEEPYVDA